jgi:hypothetical protein
MLAASLSSTVNEVEESFLLTLNLKDSNGLGMMSELSRRSE